MSKLDIQGVLENISFKTSVYTPLIEAISNSIEAIDKTKRENGEIVVTLKRSTDSHLPLQEGEDSLPEITSIEIQDNGIGFNHSNFDSFDTLYSRYKAESGGKGFGRFMYKKYFKSVNIESIYKDKSEYRSIKFSFGNNNQIIEDVAYEYNIKVNDSKTIVYLNELKQGNFDKKNTTVARKILEKLLIYFVDEKYKCPKIIIRDLGRRDIIINELLDGPEAEIQEVGNRKFQLTHDQITNQFSIKVFKVYYPGTQKSKISLSAHNREVTESSIHNYIPEFIENFYDITKSEGTKDYMIKAYVLGRYLDSNVSLERNEFKFPNKSSDLYFPHCREDIELKAAEVIRELEVFKDELKQRKDKKWKKIENYVNDEAPWHKAYLSDLDISNIPYRLEDIDIEVEIQKVKFRDEQYAKIQVKKALENRNIKDLNKVQIIVDKLSKANISGLVHYIALRRHILDLFQKALEIQDSGNYSSESTVHSIIFPLRSNSGSTQYYDHNLWIIDEKLNYTEYISSDEPIAGAKSERTDLLIYNKKIAFRTENLASNPITIFEFKKPGRDDFVDRSSKEDPIEQLIRYVNDIRSGKFVTPKGRQIEVASTTPFYGYVVCDLTEKVKDWLYSVKDYTPLPDGKGGFNWHKNNNLYIEVISWDKLLDDAEMRNKVLFKKLGIA